MSRVTGAVASDPELVKFSDKTGTSRWRHGRCRSRAWPTTSGRRQSNDYLCKFSWEPPLSSPQLAIPQMLYFPTRSIWHSG